MKKKKIALSMAVICLMLLSSLAYTFGEMNVHLKNGMVVSVPVNKEDIVGISFEGTGQAGQKRLLETLNIPNDRPIKVTSSNVLERGKWYSIEASGVISDWSHVKEGVDAVWCYADWRCGKNGELWNQLRINDKGMTDIAGTQIPYNPQHVYQVRYMGEGKSIQLYCSDAQGSSSDNSGSFTVRIYQE